VSSRPPLAELMDLTPHPEGGWFRETWRSAVAFTPAGYDGPRRAATAIYFLLHPGERSRWHVVRSDELWFWHSGGPLELLLGGTGAEPSDERAVLLGHDVGAAQHPQVLIPGGVWQAAAPAADQPVLVSCVVSPGFDYADFRLL
jgi:predicted cupin superfamily sugar epimerase